jgi:uncharacterized membrane protein
MARVRLRDRFGAFRHDISREDSRLRLIVERAQIHRELVRQRTIEEEQARCGHHRGPAGDEKPGQLSSKRIVETKHRGCGNRFVERGLVRVCHTAVARSDSSRCGHAGSAAPLASIVQQSLTEVEMGKGRLEAFSDGVIAVIITIMVLDMKVPHGESIEALVPLFPVVLSYVLSFIYVGIYWNNHHHMLHATTKVTGRILWANLHLLFWLSLIPFTTGWMGENHFAAAATALYGAVLLMSAVAYWILQQRIISSQGPDSVLKRAVGGDWKGKASPLLYAVAIPMAFASRWVALAIYVGVAFIWLIPDKRIERMLVLQEK